MAEEIVAAFSKRFPGGPLIRADNLHVQCDHASITVLFGPSGSGKSTILRCLAGLDHPDSGTIRYGKEVWFDRSRSVFQKPQRRNIGYLAQDYALFPHLNVVHNIGYGLHRLTTSERIARVSEAMRLLDLSGLEKRLPRELSGGQQQRVALARAVVRHPRLLMLDEPLSALDLPTRLRLREELRRLVVHLKIPTLIVTHDHLEALSLGDDIVVLDRGAIVQSGPVQEVFSAPANLAVAEIVGVDTVQPGKVVNDEEGLLTVAVGEIRIVALARALPTDTKDVFVCIYSEDVVLIKGSDFPSSARNHLPGTIQSVTREGPMMRIQLNCGFPLSALLTKQVCEELSLQPSDRVTAWVKAPNIHLIPR